MKIIKIQSDGKLIGSPIDTAEQGEPFDIISTYFGYVILARL